MLRNNKQLFLIHFEEEENARKKNVFISENFAKRGGGKLLAAVHKFMHCPEVTKFNIGMFCNNYIAFQLILNKQNAKHIRRSLAYQNKHMYLSAYYYKSLLRRERIN